MICDIFRTPSSWTSSARLAATFLSPRWPTVVGRRGLPCCAAVFLDSISTETSLSMSPRPHHHHHHHRHNHRHNHHSHHNNHNNHRAGGGWSSRSSPRTGSPAFCGADHRRGRVGSRGRGRPCDLLRQCSLACRCPSFSWRSTEWQRRHYRGDSTGAVLGEGGRCPCCAGRRSGSSSSWTRSLTCPLVVQRPGSQRTVKVPQIQFIAGVCGHSSSQQRRVRFQQGYGGDEWFFGLFLTFFALFQVVWS